MRLSAIMVCAADSVSTPKKFLNGKCGAFHSSRAGRCVRRVQDGDPPSNADPGQHGGVHINTGMTRMFNTSTETHGRVIAGSHSAVTELSPQELIAVSGGDGSVPQPSCTAVRVREGYVIVCK